MGKCLLPSTPRVMGLTSNYMVFVHQSSSSWCYFCNHIISPMVGVSMWYLVRYQGFICFKENEYFKWISWKCSKRTIREIILTVLRVNLILRRTWWFLISANRSSLFLGTAQPWCDCFHTRSFHASLTASRCRAADGTLNLKRRLDLNRKYSTLFILMKKILKVSLIINALTSLSL